MHPAHAAPRALAALTLASVLAASCAPQPNGGPAPRLAADPAARPGEARTSPSPERPPILGPEASAVTFDRMAKYPEPGWNVPRRVAFSPDGALVTYLQSESQDVEMALFAFDTRTKTSSRLLRARDLLQSDKPLSREEELRRERQRQHVQGVTAYAWAKRAPVMLVPLGGDVFLRRASGEVTRLTDTAEPEIDPKICDGGEKVAFVRKGELFVVDVASRKETALTRGAPEGVTRGLSDFLAQEEFGEQSGFWLSPGCDRVAYLEVDERDVASSHVLGYRGGREDHMAQRYPLPGAKNPAVRAGVLDLATKKTTWLGIPAPAGGAGPGYLGRFAWSPDGKALWLQALDREQKRLALLRADPRTGDVTEVITETSPTWLDFADAALLERSPQLVWTTVQGGHRHLELRNAVTGARVAPLTSGAWSVEGLAGVDEERGRVLFAARRETPLELHAYAAPLAGGAGGAGGVGGVGGEPVRLTKEPGDHFALFGQKKDHFVDLHSAADRPPRVAVKTAAGEVAGELPTPRDPEIDKLALRTPDFVTVKAPGGETLHAALLRPRRQEPGKRYPVVVIVYGGPGAQDVTNRWAPRLLWQHLADRGFVVFQLDNRGTAGRGPAFEAPVHGRLGDVELADQIAGVDWLRTQPFVDPARVGIYGHSYGGFMAALALLRAPDRFQVGVSASPVTDWRLYDSAYTERYMGLPSKNQAGYDATALARHAPNLKGKLFLIHALMDENVHFQNTAHLIDALVAADKTFDLLIFPGERHGYRSPLARRYAARRVVDYFVAHL